MLVENSRKALIKLTATAGVACSSRRRVASYEGQRDARLGSVAVEQSCRNFENMPRVHSDRLGSAASVKLIARYQEVLLTSPLFLFRSPRTASMHWMIATWISRIISVMGAATCTTSALRRSRDCLISSWKLVDLGLVKVKGKIRGIPREYVYIADLKLFHHVLEWRHACGHMFWLIRERFEKPFLVLPPV